MSDLDVPLHGQEFLTVRVSGNAALAEELLLIGRPASNGTVRVREWTTDTLNSPGREYDVAADELLMRLDRAISHGRSLGEDPYRVRRWLTV